MNVRVPGEGSIGAFWIVVAAMLVMLVGLFALFRRRGWL
jgi:Mg2+ and Co2+ transporter CorA